MNCDSGISNPMMADISGILKVRCETGIFAAKMFPFCIWHCGTVGDING